MLCFQSFPSYSAREDGRKLALFCAMEVMASESEHCRVNLLLQLATRQVYVCLGRGPGGVQSTRGVVFLLQIYEGKIRRKGEW